MKRNASTPAAVNDPLRAREAQYRALFDESGPTQRMQAEELARISSREIIAAREEERRAVASALHHNVGSMAVGLSAHLEAIEAEIRAGKAREALKLMRRTRKLLAASTRSLKRLAVEIRPPELDVLGLPAALRQLFARVTEQGHTRIQFRETMGRRRLSEGTATTLFRIAQEALTNAVTHGHAKRVIVSIGASKEHVMLTVRDHGTGFDLLAAAPRVRSRMGLRVMKEMAAFAGGAFTITSKPGKGATVRVILPLRLGSSA